MAAGAVALAIAAFVGGTRVPNVYASFPGEFETSAVVYNGQLHEFYPDSGPLVHDWWDGSSWHREILDGIGSSGGNGRTTSDQLGYFSRALVYNGQLQDFYYDDTVHSLRHAWWDGSAWHFETLDGSGSSGTAGASSTDDVGVDVSAVVYGTQLHAFYHDFTTQTLRHIWWNGAGWQVELLDGKASSGGNGRLTSDDVGYANSAIVYNGQLQDFSQDATVNSLRHAWWDGAAWHFETLDGSGSSGLNGSGGDSVGLFSSAVQYGTQLHDFYFDSSSSGSLRHAWWDGAAWHFETLDRTFSSDDVGQYNGAVQYNGQLQDFYLDESVSSLRHTWWDGAAWHSEFLDGPGAGTPANGSTTDSVGLGNSPLLYGSQLQDFYYDPSALGIPAPPSRHGWWNGAQWSFEALP